MLVCRGSGYRNTLRSRTQDVGSSEPPLSMPTARRQAKYRMQVHEKCYDAQAVKPYLTGRAAADLELLSRLSSTACHTKANSHFAGILMEV